MDWDKLQQALTVLVEFDRDVTRTLEQSYEEFKVGVGDLLKQRDTINSTKPQPKKSHRKRKRLDPISEESDENENIQKSTRPQRAAALKSNKPSRAKSVTAQKKGSKIQSQILEKVIDLANDSTVSDEEDKVINDEEAVKNTVHLVEESNNIRKETTSPIVSSSARICDKASLNDENETAQIVPEANQEPLSESPPPEENDSANIRKKISSPVVSSSTNNGDNAMPNDENKTIQIVPKANEEPVFKRPLPEEFNYASPNNPGLAQRITRSKMSKRDNMAKQDIKKASPEVNSSSLESTPEKRVTRSKMAKKKTNEPVIKTSPDLFSPESNLKQKSPPQSVMTTEPRTRIKDLIGSVITSGARRHNTGKENSNAVLFKSVEKNQPKCTPLQVRNALYTPASKSKIPLYSTEAASKNKYIIDDAERKKKEEEIQRKRLKEEEAKRKREIMMKAKKEEIRKKNEEKMLKVAANKEAAIRDKQEQLIKMEREKEEKERAAKELERKKEEEANKKRKLQMQKTMEAESRRMKEEAARLAKIREIDEEQKREEEIRRKQQEEMERINRQRIEEMRKNEAAMKAREMLKKQANIPMKDKENYNIENDLDDTDDDDDHDAVNNPKSEVPVWAKKEHRKKQDEVHAHIPHEVIRRYYCCPSQSPDITEFFGNGLKSRSVVEKEGEYNRKRAFALSINQNYHFYISTECIQGKLTLKRVRTSSAVWATDIPLIAEE